MDKDTSKRELVREITDRRLERGIPVGELANCVPQMPVGEFHGILIDLSREKVLINPRYEQIWVD